MCWLYSTSLCTKTGSASFPQICKKLKISQLSTCIPKTWRNFPHSKNANTLNKSTYFDALWLPSLASKIAVPSKGWASSSKWTSKINRCPLSLILISKKLQICFISVLAWIHFASFLLRSSILHNWSSLIFTTIRSSKYAKKSEAARRL